MDSRATNEFQNGFWAMVDALYEVPMETYGQPLGLGLFDPQVLAPLDWLVTQTQISKEEVLRLVEEGVLPRRKGADGEAGFILYTEAQLRLMNEIRSLGRYSDDELEHIIRYENRLIDGCFLEVSPYDNKDIPDLEIFKLRIQQEIDELAEEQAALQIPDRLSSFSVSEIQEKLENLAKERARLQKVAHFYHDRSENDLSESQKKMYKKALFRLQWREEWFRILSVNEFEAQIRQGYSPEFILLGYATDEQDRYEFGPPDWGETLAMYMDSRSRGRRFPLRTPDFVLTEDGMTLNAGVTPDRYSELYVRYRLSQLFSLVAQLGKELWNPPELAKGLEKCLACDTIFESDNPKRRYCSKECRESAKHKRWRERDPERAREANARYYARHYSDAFDMDES